MFGKQKSSPQIESAAAKGVNFEITIADLARRSEKSAWMVATISIVIVFIMLGGFLYILPLKREVPYLIMADAFTGQATVATLRGDFSSKNSITQSEALNRSNVAQYITARESFDVAMMTLRDWDVAHVMSSPDVAAGFSAVHARDNPDAPYKRYGKDRALRVKILSIQLERNGQGEAARNSATVRFQRVAYDKKTGLTTPVDSKIARLEYTYKPNLEMDEKQRYNNPLGFQVTEYTVDNDYAASPPVEIAQAQQQTAYPAQPLPGQQPYPEQPAASGSGVPAQPVQGYQQIPAAPDFGQPDGAAPASHQQPQSVPVNAGPNATNGTAPVARPQAPNQANGVGNR